MVIYDIPLVPGPTRVAPQVLAAYQTDYGSADLEPEFLELYAETEGLLQTILGTRNQILLKSGEGMVALWGAMKSTIRPGDRVLAVATGVFGYGFGEMAQAIGAEVKTVGFEYNQAAHDTERIDDAVRQFKPKMVTLVHCETPSGIINPLKPVADIVRLHDVPLFYVDAVASMGGMPVDVDEHRIDLCLGASQKALSSPPDTAIVSVSERAWEIVKEVNYLGYDALAPFQTAVADAYFPYTPNWHATAALYTACSLLLDEGLESVYKRHQLAAETCRDQVTALGLSLFAANSLDSAPTVTAINMPDGIKWEQLDAALRRHGMVVGGSYGPLAGRVFRIGHMGTQADLELVKRGTATLGMTLGELRGE